MIGRLSGTILEKHPPLVLLDVQGVAYEVDVPMSTFYQLPATGTKVTLHTPRDPKLSGGISCFTGRPAECRFDA